MDSFRKDYVGGSKLLLQVKSEGYNHDYCFNAQNSLK